jgi:hypothetical protein
MKIEFLGVLILLIGSVACAQRYPRAEDRYDRARATVREFPGRAEYFQDIDLGEHPQRGRRHDFMLGYERDYRGRMRRVTFGSFIVRNFNGRQLSILVRTENGRRDIPVTIPVGTRDTVVHFSDGLRLELHWNYEPARHRRNRYDLGHHVILRGAWYGRERAIRR